MYISDKLLDIVVTHTNTEAERVYAEKQKSSINVNKNSAKWRLTNRTEIPACIRLVTTAGHLKQNHLSQSNLRDKKYGPPIFIATMPQYRFIALTRFMRFDDKGTRTVRHANDKLAPIRDLFNEVNKLLLRYYTPSEYLTVDEQLVPFQDCCTFRQYIPSKPDKYDMKIFWICDAMSFYSLQAEP